MKTIVLDTSALMRLFIPDGPIPDGLDQLILDAEKDEVDLLAPNLIIIESAQVLLKKSNQELLTKDEAESLFGDIRSLPIRLFEPAEFIKTALSIAIDQNITVYDALFVSIAQYYSATLVTVDSKLKKTAIKLKLNTL